MPGEPSLTVTYTDLATTTLKNFLQSGKLFDVVFDESEVLNWYRRNGRARVIQGGERLSGGIMDKKNNTVKSYSGSEELNVTIQNIGTRWFLNPKLYSVSVGITGDDMTSNRGPEQMVNLLTERIENGSMSLADRLATDVCEDDGTGNNSKNITGFPAMMATDPTTGTYASINAANNSKWRNQIQTGIGNAASQLLPAMRTIDNDCRQGSMREGKGGNVAWFTNQTIHEALEALLFPMFRFQADGNSARNADMGVGMIYYKGGEVLWDPHITTTGTIYRLNDRYTELVVYSGRNFEMDDEGLQKPVNQDARIGQVFFKGQVVTYARNKLGKGTGIT